MATLWMFTWTEYERGWGQRPDGCSLHLSKEDAKKYIDNYWKKQRAEDGGVVPHEYSKQDSDEPKEIIIDGRNKFYKRVAEAKKKRQLGIRLWQSELRELESKMDTRPRVGR